MVHLYHVSASLLAAGGHEDNVIDKPFDGTSYQGRNARSALPTTSLQMRTFFHAESIPDGDMLLINVTLKEEDYNVPISLNYRKNMAIVTMGLTEKFGVACHKIVTGREEGDQSESAHIQQVIISINYCIKGAHQ